MQSSFAGSIVGSEVHGFRTMEDLDMVNVLEEAKKRWLRPNEIHAILSNYNYFRVQVKPVNLPPSGTIVMYDRKKLRNFRKDGHNWKKKQDGKTVKEAHEHLKVGDEERIHVYYAHGKDNPTFVRRCYWLLDKSLEHIVLVHYRETQEGSAAAPMNSNSSSGVSDPSATWHSPQDTDFVVDQACYFDPRKLESDTSEAMNIRNQELRLHEINTLDWDELLVPEDTNKLITTQEAGRYSVGSSYQHEVNGHKVDCDSVSDNKLPADYLGNFPGRISASNPANFNDLVPVKFRLQSADNEISLTSQQKNSIVAEDDLMENLIQNGLQTDASFEIWTNEPNTDLFVSVDASIIESSISTTNRYSHNSTTNEHHLQSSAPEYPFCIADVSPSCAVSTEETKVLVVGRFCAGYSDHVKSNLFCILGDVRLPAQFVQPGVYRCIVPPQTPGVKNLFLSLDGHKPVSQVTTFEFRAPKQNDNFTYSDDNSSLEFLQVQMRLARLLFSTSKNMSILSSKASQKTLKEAENFYHRISNIENSWVSLSEAIKANQISFMQAKSRLFELTLQNRMYEWLLERVVGGSKDAERDPQGQGVIHLCAMLNYTWAVYPFSWSGLSLDYRDKFGWTALHWAACNGREKMVAKLLSAGAKASLVTDPTSENPGGCTAADLASKNGHEGLAAYLAEKGLIQHFEEMTLAGNVSGSLQPETDQVIDPVNFTDEELYLKDALAAYRTAAGAAARIQAAFREHSFKIMSKSVEESNPEDEARKIVAAMRIQHAFRNYDTKKKMVAAARIQHRFRGWKIRRDFVNMRRQAIKIQAIFRGFQIRKQYRKIIWSVGVLEKAILRWRLKRKGFRGIQVNPDELINDEKQEEGNVEEDFFKVSRQQAEERVERSVVRVQALFRSKRAQEEYRRMKLEFSTAALEYDWASTN